MGIDLETVRNEVEKRLEKEPDQEQVQGAVPYTARVKRVLTLAAKEARALHHTYVGTEHLLLGLLAEDEGSAGSVLRNLHADIEQTRLEILKEIDPNFESEASRSAGREAASPASQVKVELSSGCTVDTHQCYDVYCVEGNQKVVVYRNARLKSTKYLFPNNSADPPCVFVELEDRNQQLVFIARSSVLRFCKPGVVPAAEEVTPPRF